MRINIWMGTAAAAALLITAGVSLADAGDKTGLKPGSATKEAAAHPHGTAPTEHAAPAQAQAPASAPAPTTDVNGEPASDQPSDKMKTAPSDTGDADLDEEDKAAAIDKPAQAKKSIENTADAEDAPQDAPAQDFAQGAQPANAACTPPSSDDPATWLCEAEGPVCGTSNAARWVHRSAEYQALVAQTFHFASLQALTYGKTYEPGTWVVAVDLDETIISNAMYTVERDRCGHGYSRESWADWSAAERATPLPGAKAFMDLVYAQGGLVVGVTNRREQESGWTKAVLKRFDLPVEFVLYRGDSDGASGEKEARWNLVPALLASQGHRDAEIVMWMGDQITDFPELDQSIYATDGQIQGPFGTRYIVLPNPMYGEWEHTE